MSSLDFRPAPGAAPAGTRVISHALIEAKLLVRNGEQLLLALVIPLGILIVGAVAGGRFGDLAELSPSVAALAVWSSAFTSTAIATGFERRYGVLERLASTPLGRVGLLSGKALAVVMIVLGQLLVLSLIGLALGWRPVVTLGTVAVSILAVVVATATFAALAVALAGRLRAEGTLAVANLIYVAFLAGGALVLPVSRYPDVLEPVIRLLPTAALGEAVRAASAGTLLGWPFLVLGVWLVAAVVAAWKGFRWTA